MCMQTGKHVFLPVSFLHTHAEDATMTLTFKPVKLYVKILSNKSVSNRIFFRMNMFLLPSVSCQLRLNGQITGSIHYSLLCGGLKPQT